MGWTYFRPSAGKPTLEILREELPSLTFHETAVVGRTFYAACTHPSEPGVFGLVVLIDRRNGEFGYKDMGEEMGPCESECPARILDKLSDPPPNDYARDWRARCREAAG
jgi:hypothetical protein